MRAPLEGSRPDNRSRSYRDLQRNIRRGVEGCIRVFTVCMALYMPVLCCHDTSVHITHSIVRGHYLKGIWADHLSREHMIFVRCKVMLDASDFAVRPLALRQVLGSSFISLPRLNGCSCSNYACFCWTE